MSISQGQDIRTVIKPTRWVGPERLQGTLVSLPASPFPDGHHLIRRPTHADTHAPPPRSPGTACCGPPVPPGRLARLCRSGGHRHLEHRRRAGQDHRKLPATLVAKVAAVLVSGVTAFLTARSHSTARLAGFGAVTRASALAALFPGVLLGG